MTQRLGLPMPKIYVIPDRFAECFRDGRNPKHASVAVTRGILQLLDDEELEGVLAHELGHVKNRDILTSSIVGNARRSDYAAGADGLLGFDVYRRRRRQ